MHLRSASDCPAAPAPEAVEGSVQGRRAARVFANRLRAALEATDDAVLDLIQESERQSGFGLVGMLRRRAQQPDRRRPVMARLRQRIEGQQKPKALVEPKWLMAVTLRPWVAV